MPTMNQNATNVVECSACGWKRMHDSYRDYRGGHENPQNMQECHEMLVHHQASPFPPEVYMLGETRPKMTEAEIATLAASTEQADRDQAVTESARNASLDSQIAALYELEGSDVDTALAAAAAT